MTRLSGKRALITGAGRGIGLAFAHGFAREGAKVVLADIDIARAMAASAAIGKAAIPVELDVSDIAAAERLVDRFEGEGGFDILVNNAAIFVMAPVTHVTAADYERVFDVNVKGPLFLMKAVANAMISAGRRGKIINMASQAGRRGEALVTLYCATKAAIISLTQSAALALIRHGINVNAIAPGVVEGEHWDGVDAEFAKWEHLPPGEKKRRVAAAVPIGRMARPEDLVGMAIFLASEESGYVVGQTYNVDGGNWLS